MHHHRNAVKALVKGIQSVNMENDAGIDQDVEMENIFKDTYLTIAFFSKTASIEPNVYRQVYDLPSPPVDQLIDRDDFFLSFTVHCI